ncbi:alpha/beta fold hydrolase [Anaeromyxobacter sp. PSR-1]|uniref:alpha/beta fold hydrolase n=1 Tax=unclassified Anaeromyxobacter TaxID=2620896 RepID=UPI0005DF590A|nr:alpha/beta hydrolase [Anaeromyxobacter sp. PSR-1]GAO03174.1 4,5:9,10-diseco-3-hydroxy-5,9, 17-trioxoandrosta-1(10),2-diene-4-oate hydrolase [Anaeromyxobacter sp. PSR-1]
MPSPRRTAALPCLLPPLAALALACAGAPPRAPATALPAGAVDPDAAAFEYPLPVSTFELDSQRQRLRMAYVDAPAAKPNGRTVLLLHGKNFHAGTWAETIAALNRAGFRVIAPDQIGFGKSSKPERYQFSFAQLAANTRALLASLGVERTAVVGHSMGGMLAVRYALEYPEATERLLLVNPIGLEDYAAFLPPRTVDQWYAQELKQTPDSVRDYQRQAYYDGAWKPEYEAHTRLLAGWTLHPGWPRVAWVSALTYDMIVTQPVVHELERLRVPTRLVIGLRDRTAIGRPLAPAGLREAMGDYTRLGKAAQRRIPGAELVELPGIGHVPQVEAFPAFERALLDFLR